MSYLLKNIRLVSKLDENFTDLELSPSTYNKALVDAIQALYDYIDTDNDEASISKKDIYKVITRLRKTY